LFEKAGDIHTTPIEEVMTRHCTKISAEILAVESVRIMKEKRISALLVADEDNRLIGALNMHDLLRAGVV